MSSSISFTPLQPSSFLSRSATVFATRTAVIDGEQHWTYHEFHQRCLRLAGALAELGVYPGDRVAILAPNTHVLLEAHFGVPMAGAVLVPLNFRQTPHELSTLVVHSGARVLLFDQSLAASADLIARSCPQAVQLIECGRSSEYEERIVRAAPAVPHVGDERDLLSINYTSGTTGKPKGVMYHHRGAYLQALAMALHLRLDCSSVFLWTLPMFHCDGWCFPWAVTAAGACHVCLPEFDPDEVWHLIRRHRVTHLNGAPTVLNTLAEAREAAPLEYRLSVATGGSPPAPALIARLANLSIEVTHLYGLTETFGPIALCEWIPEWNELPIEEQAARRARQGVGNVIATSLRVIDKTGNDVSANGREIGEIAVRGNDVMLGYYRDPEATSQACRAGWFLTGDLAVLHPDGHVEIKDRAKDVIITGGENVSSIEVEQVLVSHPKILEAAVVAAPDPHWGEVPVAYVTVKEGEQLAEADVIEFARQRLTHFKCPKRVVFVAIPKTSTGKIEKYVLRTDARFFAKTG